MATSLPIGVVRHFPIGFDYADANSTQKTAAHNAYVTAAAKLHGEFANSG
jgi:hypothetical protein